MLQAPSAVHIDADHVHSLYTRARRTRERGKRVRMLTVYAFGLVTSNHIHLANASNSTAPEVSTCTRFYAHSGCMQHLRAGARHRWRVRSAG